MAKEFIRKLIEVEIRLGFLNIPSKAIELIPDEKTTLLIHLDGSKELIKLSYNAEYKRYSV